MATKKAAAALPAMPPVPDDLAGWHWELTDQGLRLTCPDEGWITSWYPADRESGAIVEARERVAADAAVAAQESPERAFARSVLAEYEARQAAAATAWRPGPDAGGVYRRPPELAERVLCPPRDLVDGRWQPREVYDEASLQELAASITEHGVIADLLAIVNEYRELELIAGHRRKRAALLAGGRDVPVKILEVTAAQAFELAVIDNDQRQDLSDLERGKAYERIIAEQGISEAELARRLSRPRAYIQQRRMLAQACPELQQAVTSGKLSFTAARAICLGSGGSHQVQQAVTAWAIKDAAGNYPATAAQLQERAEITVREHCEKDLKRLGWKLVRFWTRNSGSKNLVFAPTVKPAVWSSAEYLAAVAQIRRPPDDGRPAPLAGEDRAALDARGWQLDTAAVSPWTIGEHGKELVIGDAADFAPHVAAAKRDLADLAGRFEAKAWAVEWTKSGMLKATPPALAEPGKKPKKLAALTMTYRDAAETVKAVEKGTWTPTTKTAEASRSSYRCERCKAPTTAPVWKRGGYHCPDCAAAIDAEDAALRAELARIVDSTLGLWLDTAPDVAAALILLQSNRLGGIEEVKAVLASPAPERGAALREQFTHWLWWKREHFSMPAPEGATAVAAPPEELASDASANGSRIPPTSYAQWHSYAQAFRAHIASGAATPADAATLEWLDGELETLADDGGCSEDEYDEADTLLSEMAEQLDALGVAP